MRPRAIILLATLVPLLMVGIAVVPRHVDRRWEEMAAWAAKTEAEWQGHDFRREPAWGEAGAGSAFAAYRDAMEQAAVLGRDDARLEADLRLSPERTTTAEREAYTTRWAAAIAALHAGAHRADARPNVVWAHGIGQQMLSLLAGRSLQNAATIAARAAIERGDSIAAVRLVLDAAAFAVDLQNSPLLVDRLIGATLLQKAVDQTLRDAELRRLDAAATLVLADGLARLDAQLGAALAIDLTGEALLNARTVLAGAPPEAGNTGGEASAPRQARFAFSRRWAAADAVMALVAGGERLRQAAALSWPEREELLATVESQWQHGENEMLRRIAPPVRTMELAVRRGAVHLRLLRLLLAARAGGELPVLADPLGDGLLQVERGEATVRVRSAGGGQPIEREFSLR